MVRPDFIEKVIAGGANVAGGAVDGARAFAGRVAMPIMLRRGVLDEVGEARDSGQRIPLGKVLGALIRPPTE